MTSKFARFESSWLQSVGNAVENGVQNRHNWSGPVDDAANNICHNDNVIQLGPLRS